VLYADICLPEVIMTKWRYLVENILVKDFLKNDRYFETKGETGWELVTIFRTDPIDAKVMVIFKQPVQE
jgi:hypothetical protein